MPTPKIIPNGEPVIFAEGRIGAIVQFPVLVSDGKISQPKRFEKFVRPPGTRVIAVKDEKIYLQKERRLEKGSEADWRLPGGKVVDTFEEYKPYLSQPIPEAIILVAAAKELREEAGLEAASLSLFSKQACGATVEWDLYYVLAEEVHEVASDHLEAGEDIEESGWFTYSEVLEKCRFGEISEGRTVAALLQFVSKHGIESKA